MPSGAKYFQPTPSVILQRISNFNCRRIIDMLAQFARAELNYPLNQSKSSSRSIGKPNTSRRKKCQHDRYNK